MNKIQKRIIAIAALTLISSTSVYAEPASNSTANNMQQAENIEMKVEKLDNQIEEVMSKIDNNKKEITKTQSELKSATDELEKAKKDMKNQQDIMNKRMRAIYISGLNGYLSVILESDSIMDFISRVDMVKKIISYDNKIISTYKTKQEDINKKKDKLITQNNRLLSLKADNDKKLNQLNLDKNNQKKLLEEANKQQRLFALSEQSAVSAAVRQVADIRKAAPRVDLSRGGSISNVNSNNVIAYASNFLGTPYVWGGTSPNPGFDCSGFTQYVYRHFGVSLGRTTYDQINNGVGVSRDQLQPGDLVFFGTSSDPHHMGIYVGNGAYIHAPRTGDSIKISPMNRSDYLTARRVN